MYGFKIAPIKDSGNTTECMEMENQFGSMVVHTMVNTSTIKNMDLEHSVGLMAGSMSDCGKMENNMEEESISSPMEIKKQDNGFKAKKLSGLSKIVPE